MSRSGCFRQIVERLSVSLTGGLSKDKRGVISHTTVENGSRAFTSSVSNTGLLDLRHALFKNATRRGQTRLASSSSSGKPAANKGASASGPDAAAAERINYVSYRSLGMTMLTGAGLWWYFDSLQKDRMERAAAKGAKQAKVAGAAAIGGDFELIESESGKPFCLDDLKGKFSLLYFGFTHCPDVCPDELEKISSAVEMVNKEVSKGAVKPVFITLDPERDGAKQVSAYVKEFHPDMIGLTGSKDAITQVTKAYRVYFTKAGVGEMTGNNKEKDEDYLIDHSIITYLLDPEGEFVTFYGKNYTDREMATSIVQNIMSWKPNT